MIIRSSDLHTLEIPHEPGESVVIRKLNRKQMRRAAEKRSIAAMEKAVGMAEFMTAQTKALFDGLGTTQLKEAIDKVKEDTLQVFDEDTLLELGVATWSYRDKDTGEPIEVNKENRDNLDEVTAEFVARSIVQFHRGELGDSKNV